MKVSNIAAAINAAHERVEAAKQEGVRHAIECGKLLLAAKDTVEHGGWEAWVKAHCAFSPRTAQLYMRVAKHVGDDPAKAQRVADFSLREAARATASRRLPDKANASLHQVLALWFESTAEVRRRFARHIFEQGDISESELAQLLMAADLAVDPAIGVSAG